MRIGKLRRLAVVMVTYVYAPEYTVVVAAATVTVRAVVTVRIALADVLAASIQFWTRACW